MQETALIITPVGRLRLFARGEALTHIEFETGLARESIPEHHLLRAAIRQVRGYFEDPRTAFSLPLAMTGTEHARRVWAALREIPLGRTETYGSLARRLGSGARAVAGACRANAFPILIPCHRVVAADGLGGYCGRIDGPMLDLKHWLLEHEARGLA